MKSNKIVISYIFAFVSVLCWGVSAAAVKATLKDIDFWNLVFYTNVLATVVFFIAILYKKQVKNLFHYKFVDFRFFISQSFLGMGIYRILFNLGVSLSNAQEAFVSNYTWPILVILFSSYLYKEKVSRTRLILLVVSFIGIVIVVLGAQLDSFKISHLKGDSLAFLAAIFFALYSAKNKNNTYNKLAFMFYCYLFATILSSVGLLFSQNPRFIMSSSIGYLYIGIFVLALANICWVYALEHGNIYVVTNIVFISPIISLAAVSILVGEKLILTALIGTIITVVGLTAQSILAKYRKSTQLDPRTD